MVVPAKYEAKAYIFLYCCGLAQLLVFTKAIKAELSGPFKVKACKSRLSYV